MNKNQKPYVTFDLGIEAAPADAKILPALSGFFRSAKNITFMFQDPAHFAVIHINEAKRRIKYNADVVDTVSYKVYGATDPIRVSQNLNEIKGPIHSVRISAISVGGGGTVSVMVK